MNYEITSYLDFAQLALYLFWIFFALLIYYIRREDRREGYPLETDVPRRVQRLSASGLYVPTPKTFKRPDGSTYSAPDFQRDERDMAASRVNRLPGQPHVPDGDPMLSGVGPASWADRHDEPELTREGHLAVVPMRVASDYSVSAGSDPRGWDVVAGDGEVAGKVKDIWIDRADMVVRYFEVDLGSDGNRLVPYPMSVIHDRDHTVEVSSIYGKHFPHVPALKEPDQVSALEEEKIGAFYAGGRLYADPKRLEPVL